jgi:hypothetical protein
MNSKEPKCDCADVIGRNQVCDICQGVKEYHHEGYLKLTEYPLISWDQYLTIRLPKAPNIFYRWMMTLFFGFRWKRIK